MMPLSTELNSSVLAAAWDVNDPQTWAAAATVATAVIALVAAAIALRQVREARRLRVEQAEPYVAASLEVGPNSSPFMIYLVVKNFGATAAFNIRLNSEVPLQNAIGENGIGKLALPEVLRTLVPGQEWRTLFDSAIERGKTDLPDIYEVEVAFEAHGKPRIFRGSQRKAKKISYDYTLDFAALKETQFVTEKGVDQAVQALEKISNTLSKWTESGSGLRAVVRSGEAIDKQRLVARQEQIQRIQRLQSEGVLPGDFASNKSDESSDAETLAGPNANTSPDDCL